MNEFVPPCWHGCAIEVSRSCQQGGTIVTIGWHKPDNCNIVYIEAKNTIISNDYNSLDYQVANAMIIKELFEN